MVWAPFTVLDLIPLGDPNVNASLLGTITTATGGI